MRIELRWLVTVCCLGITLLAVGTWAYGQARTQAVNPTVISGNDIGFRIEGTRGDRPVGTLVIRVNGQWVEPDFGSGVQRLTAK